MGPMDLRFYWQAQAGAMAGTVGMGPMGVTAQQDSPAREGARVVWPINTTGGVWRSVVVLTLEVLVAWQASVGPEAREAMGQGVGMAATEEMVGLELSSEQMAAWGAMAAMPAMAAAGETGATAKAEALVASRLGFIRGLLIFLLESSRAAMAALAAMVGGVEMPGLATSLRATGAMAVMAEMG